MTNNIEWGDYINDDSWDEPNIWYRVHHIHNDVLYVFPSNDEDVLPSVFLAKYVKSFWINFNNNKKRRHSEVFNTRLEEIIK